MDDSRRAWRQMTSYECTVSPPLEELRPPRRPGSPGSEAVSPSVEAHRPLAIDGGFDSRAPEPDHEPLALPHRPSMPAAIGAPSACGSLSERAEVVDAGTARSHLGRGTTDISRDKAHENFWRQSLREVCFPNEAQSGDHSVAALVGAVPVPRRDCMSGVDDEPSSHGKMAAALENWPAESSASACARTSPPNSSAASLVNHRARARTSKHLAERIGILGKAPDQAAGREPGSCSSDLSRLLPPANKPTSTRTLDRCQHWLLLVERADQRPRRKDQDLGQGA
ncbi:uncharacterized protein PG986_000002 [Apiospora aurea]|uniref:Uncharacterized protein n=1 Tax=Apiospora aurea TaxID=335848 RepID=A0ABR1QSV2_9PEZI